MIMGAMLKLSASDRHTRVLVSAKLPANEASKWDEYASLHPYKEKKYMSLDWMSLFISIFCAYMMWITDCIGKNRVAAISGWVFAILLSIAKLIGNN